MDTGAPITLFDPSVAYALDLDARRSVETGRVRVLGGDWPVRFEHVEVHLAGQPELSWTLRAAFVTDPAFQMPFQGVLGTEGFLDRFVVTFNAYDDYFLVERPGDWHDRVGDRYATA